MRSFTDIVRAAVHRLFGARSYSVVAILTFGVGVGLALSIFAVLDSVFWRPLPIGSVDRLAVVAQVSAANPLGPVALPYIREWQAASKSFSNIGYYSLTFSSTAVQRDHVRVINVVSSPNLFDTLQVTPSIGRVFHAADGAGPVAVLSASLAKALYRGGNAIGRPLTMNHVVHTVMGVMPDGFYFPLTNPGLALWTRIVPSRQWEDKKYAGLQVIARLAPGVPVESAEHDLNARSRSDKDWQKETRLAVTSYREYVTGSSARSLIYLQSAAMLVWLLGCFNIAGLSVSYTIKHRQRITLQKSLGAPFQRLIIECLVESSILSTLGCLIGLLFASLSVGAFEQLLEHRLPFSPRLEGDWPICLALLGTALASSLLISIVPVL